MYSQTYITHSSLGNKSKGTAYAVTMLLLIGFGTQFYGAGAETLTKSLGLNKALDTAILQVSQLSHELGQYSRRGGMGGGDSFGGYSLKTLIGGAIGVTFIVVMAGIFLNQTKILTSGDATHAATISGPGATILGATLLGLIIAAGVVYVILRIFHLV